MARIEEEKMAALPTNTARTEERKWKNRTKDFGFDFVCVISKATRHLSLYVVVGTSATIFFFFFFLPNLKIIKQIQ